MGEETDALVMYPRGKHYFSPLNRCSAGATGVRCLSLRCKLVPCAGLSLGILTGVIRPRLIGSILLRRQWSKLLRILAWRPARKVSPPRTQVLGNWLIGLGLASHIFCLTSR